MTSSLRATLERDRDEGEMREKCVARGRDDGGSCSRQGKARYRTRETEGEGERRAKGDFREILAGSVG